jgi:hypothetical protein
MQRAPLRVGVMIGGALVPRWVAYILDRIEACSFADVVGFVRNIRSPPPEPARPARSRLLYGLYSRLDARRFGTEMDPFDRIDLSDRVRGLPVAEVTVVGEIEQWDLDVILNLGSGTVRGAILDCARHGVWSYRCGDPDSYRGGPPLFWEIYDGAPVSASALQRLTGDPDGDEVIYRSSSATDPISLHRSRTRVYWKSAEFVVRKLRDLHRDGELSVLPRGDRAGPEAPIHHTPTNRQMLRFGLRLATRLAGQKVRQTVAREQWYVAYRPREAGPPTGQEFRGATVLVPRSDRFYADPCLVDRRGLSYLFFEDFRFATGKGVISACQLTPDGRSTRPQIVLERPYHLSYPFVFLVGEDAFMLPETAANRSIELYRAHSFPSDWALEAVLVSDVRAVDPTLVERDERFWLFANIAAEGASTNDELFLFSARSVRGPWEPHPRNPIVSDVRRARPAGRPFIDASGSLIRPSQDCSGFYGSAVVFNRIEELSETDYRETPVGRLEPSWQRRNLGTHTYTRSEKWEAVDGRSWARRESRRRRS